MARSNRSQGIKFVIATSVKAIRMPTKTTNMNHFPNRGRDLGSPNM